MAHSRTLISRAAAFGDRTAIVDGEGEHSYAELLEASAGVAARLLDGAADLGEARVAFLVPPGFGYPAVQWGVWRAGGVCVPLCTTHPRPELEYVVEDCGAEILVAHPEFEPTLRPIAEERGLRLLTVESEVTPASPSGHPERSEGSQPGSFHLASHSHRSALRPRHEHRSPSAGGDRQVEILHSVQDDRGVQSGGWTQRGAEPTPATEAPERPNARTPERLPSVACDRRALILYTSGTTSRPKGVVTTHANIEAQVRSLVDAWEWTADDRILHFLPLHHIHGIINVLCCALWPGATCRMLPRFHAGEVWDRLIEEELTLFMAVPTIYVKLIAAWEAATPERRRQMSEACRKLRLMVSGSAALPVPVLEQWREISGHTLLERYGMTEIGMGLSNPLHGLRRPGHVGTPLPGIEARLVDDAGGEVPAGAPGEIWVRGPGVFREYWGRPEATTEAFRGDWFRTGDVAVLDEGSYRILGRSSVDIIKTGGYKVSALEIEEVLLSHPLIRECAVVGVPDPEWGERVCAAVVLRDPGPTAPNAQHPTPNAQRLSVEELRAWGRQRMAAYKLPSRLLAVDSLPRNAMGKVTKPEVTRLFSPAPAS